MFKGRFLLLSVLLAFFAGMGASVASAQLPAPKFDYEWIKGHPLVTAEQEAVLRVTMHGDVDDPTSPGLVLSGFNIAVQIPEGVVDETTVSIPGGGDKFSEIIPETPSDDNAYGSPKVRLLSDYRLVADAYPSSVYPTPPDDGRDERNAMLWDNSGFIVEDLGTAPAGFLQIAITGVGQRLESISPLGDIPTRRNDLTEAEATSPLGPAGSTTGTSQRAAFLDIKFTVLDTADPVDRANFFYNIMVMANPNAVQTFSAEDHLPNPSATQPSVPKTLALDSNTFLETDGADNDSQPQILQDGPTQTTFNASWELYQ